MMVLPLAATLVWACGDDPDKKKKDDDGAGGNATTSGAGGATASSGAGGSASVACVDISAIEINQAGDPCSAANQTNCECNGCGNSCDDGAGNLSDCLCSVCAGDSFCTTCQDDGMCDPFNEGCTCADCADHPLCAAN